MRNEAIAKEAEARKQSKSGGKFDLARNNGKKQVFETAIRTYDEGISLYRLNKDR
jgi:hypothetical protein